MKNSFFIILLTIWNITAHSQTKSRFSLQPNYGLTGNFFVTSYDEESGPVNKKYFYKKNFLGTNAGMELLYRISEKSEISLGYDRSVNKGKKNFLGVVSGVNVNINDFTIRHTNNFFQLIYSRPFIKTVPTLKLQVGTFLLTSSQQEIALESFSSLIELDERNYKNSGLMEGGVLLGIQYSKKIDTKFELGIRSRIYCLVSTSSLEAVTLTPTLTYHF